MKLNMNIFAGVFVVIMLAEALGLGFTYFDSRNSKQQAAQLLKESENLKDQLSTTETELVSLKSDHEKLKSDHSTLLKDFSITSEKLSALETENDELQSRKDEFQQKLNESRTQNNELEKLFMCDEAPISVDFKDNASVSRSLTRFVEGWKAATEPVSSHHWNIVWSTEKYSIHTVQVYSERDNITYIWKFTAYFDRENNGLHKNGIFWNDRQCWLYLKR